MTLLRTSLISLFALTPLFAGVALSQEAEPQTVEELVAAVKATYGEVNAIKADFIQVTRSPTLGEQKQRGKVSLKRPKMMKWDSTNTGGSLFVTNGEKMWLYTPADKTVLVYNDLGAAGGGADMVNVLTNLDSLGEQFDTKMMTPEEMGNKKSIGVKLKPKVESQYKDVTLVFSKKKYEIEEVTVVDHFGVETQITFSQVKINPELDAGEFSFDPPKGVEVINADGI